MLTKFFKLFFIFIWMNQMSGQMIPITNWLYGLPYPEHHFVVNDKIRRNGQQTDENQYLRPNAQNIPQQNSDYHLNNNLWPFLTIPQNYRPIPYPSQQYVAPYELNIQKNPDFNTNPIQYQNIDNNVQNSRKENIDQNFDKELKEKPGVNHFQRNNGRNPYSERQIILPIIRPNMEFHPKSPQMMTFQPMTGFERFVHPFNSHHFMPTSQISPLFSSTNPTPVFIKNGFEDKTNKRFNEIKEFDRNPVFYAPNNDFVVDSNQFPPNYPKPNESQFSTNPGFTDQLLVSGSSNKTKYILAAICASIAVIILLIAIIGVLIWKRKRSSDIISSNTWTTTSNPPQSRANDLNSRWFPTCRLNTTSNIR